MPRYANFSPDATRLLAAKTGNAKLECYICIDPSDSGKSFFLLRYPDKMLHVYFSEIKYDPFSFSSLIDGLYDAIYN
jgi:hypothetical protein